MGETDKTCTFLQKSSNYSVVLKEERRKRSTDYTDLHGLREILLSKMKYRVSAFRHPV
jgi:hypothetical protein